jgi:protein tyrosine phosphatase (PTP) superfamily phosphohydrolase (DUF442 family)
VQGQLIFTPCPGTKDVSVAEALGTLKAAGASALLTLMPTEELSQNEVGNLSEQCQRQGIEWFHLPVEDDQAPAESFQAAWEANRERIKQLLTEGKNIAIHCKGGSFREAIGEVQALRPRAIQHPAHIDYISQFDIAKS